MIVHVVLDVLAAAMNSTECSWKAKYCFAMLNGPARIRLVAMQCKGIMHSNPLYSLCLKAILPAFRHACVRVSLREGVVMRSGKERRKNKSKQKRGGATKKAE